MSIHILDSAQTIGEATEIAGAAATFSAKAAQMIVGPDDPAFWKPVPLGDGNHYLAYLRSNHDCDHCPVAREPRTCNHACRVSWIADRAGVATCGH
jgi:hypothetical protein